MKLTINQYYPFQVWLTSLLLSPILWMFISAMIGIGDLSGWPFVFLALLYGLFFSLPAWLIYYYIFRTLVRKSLSEQKLKVLLCLTANGLLAATFGIIFILSDSVEFKVLLFISCYIVGIAVGSFCFRINRL